MATAAADQPQASNPPLEWVDKALQNAVNIQLGADGIALDRRQRNSEIAYALTEFAATADQEKLAKRLGEVADGSGEGADDMGVSVGNTITNYYGTTPGGTTSSTVGDATTIAKPGSIASQIAPAAATAAQGLLLPNWLKIAALVGGVGVSAAGGSAIGNWITNAPAVTVTNSQPGNPADITGAVTPLP